jgi:hypothetical protein
MMTGKRTVIFSIVMFLAALALLVAYMRVVTPSGIQNPQLEHAHVRMQLFVDGQSVDFADEEFQRPTPAGCTDALPEEPIHFHDRKNQFVHLHWKGMSGGLVLKNYGWNLIGGKAGLLGYRMDRLPLIQNRVPIYGDVLPKLSEDAELWVYSGDKNGFVRREAHDFLFKDFETFFNTKSAVGTTEPDFWRDLMFARSAAHEGHDHSAEGAALPKTKTEAELSRINNLLGNVVVFAQKNKPTDVQVKDAFNRLEPLSDSTCGG